MALTQSEIGRELDQHGEDIGSLHELVEQVRVEMNARSTAHDQRFDGLEQRFDQVDATLAEVLRRLPA